MPISDEFVDYVIDQLSAWGEVSARKMFGGAGLYRDGTMFGLIADDVAWAPDNDPASPKPATKGKHSRTPVNGIKGQADGQEGQRDKRKKAKGNPASHKSYAETRREKVKGEK